MNKLPVYNNPKPIPSTPEQIKEARKLVTEMIDNLDFLRTRLSDRPTYNDVHTQLGLLEYQLTDLGKLTDYTSVLIEEKASRNKQLREANQTIHALEQKLGTGITPQGISNKLQEYESLLHTFAKALGIDYLRIERFTSFGILCEITPECYETVYENQISRKEHLAWMVKHVQPIASSNTAYDIQRDTYHCELLDTDNNRNRLTRQILETLPNTTIYGFESRKNDYESFSLTMKCQIYYTDIEALKQQIITQETEETHAN